MTQSMSEVVLVVGAVLMSCGAPEAMATLDVSASRRDIIDARPLRIRVAAVQADGKIGTGQVTLESEQGTITEPTLTLDGYGTAMFELICDPVQNTACSQPFTVSATWKTGKTTAEGEVRVNTSGTQGTGGSGGSSGTGGGGGSSNPTAKCQQAPDGSAVTTNLIHVRGSAGAGLSVDFVMIGDVTAGQSALPAGFWYATYPSLVVPSLPWMKGVTLALHTDELTPNQVEVGNNSGQAGPVPAGQPARVDFSMWNDSTLISCPGGQGTGQFMITSLTPRIIGTYSFSCPTNQISVSGCFSYR